MRVTGRPQCWTLSTGLYSQTISLTAQVQGVQHCRSRSRSPKPLKCKHRALSAMRHKRRVSAVFARRVQKHSVSSLKIRAALAGSWQVSRCAGGTNGPRDLLRNAKILPKSPARTRLFRTAKPAPRLKIAVLLDNDSLTDGSPLIHGLVRRNRPSDWHSLW